MASKSSTLFKYMELDTGERVQVLYVWIDGTGEGLRCKTKTVEFEPQLPEDLPVWNFDGSSTGQASGANSDVYLHPVALFRDPFRRGKNKILMCETSTFNHKPALCNHRQSCNDVMDHETVKVFIYKGCPSNSFCPDRFNDPFTYILFNGLICLM